MLRKMIEIPADHLLEKFSGKNEGELKERAQGDIPDGKSEDFFQEMSRFFYISSQSLERDYFLKYAKTPIGGQYPLFFLTCHR